MPEILNHERLIVVLGMARSGTTIFTYVLCRHPEIALFRGGSEAWLLENDCLPRWQANRIGRVTELFPEAKYVVLKRPWQEEHAEWLREHMPRARFVVLVRDREAIKRSWATTGRWALAGRQQALNDPDACYDVYLRHARRLPDLLGAERCRLVHYERMIETPRAVFDELADWLGVERRFDCAPIGDGLHWRSELAEEFPRGDALLDGSATAEGFGIRQHWRGETLLFDGAADLVYQRPPTLGMVVGTFAATPYVHLQLEARRRLFPNVPLLVHDDGSHAAERLQQLCGQYGADFEASCKRLPRTIGDVSVFVGGLKWAQARGIDLLLKVSRRWVFLVDWTESLRELALSSQHATFSNYTKTFNFGFRTECVGLATAQWASPAFFRDAVGRINAGRRVFVEGYIHQCAIKLHEQGCAQALRWSAEHPVPNQRRGYAAWSLMGTDRVDRNPPGNYLWHDSHSPRDYARQAAAWGLPYSEADFADPNERAGRGPANVR